MKVTEYGAIILAAIVFLLLTLGGFLGTIYCTQMLAQTNQLIFLLLALGSLCVLVVSVQCVVKFTNKL